MTAAREWYQTKGDGRVWALKQAMLTIKNASPTGQAGTRDPATEGRVTWLRALDADGLPLVRDSKCPAMLPTSLEGKDWTRYEGVLHTDHAVREEFFIDREAPPMASKPYLMDFTYLYDTHQHDYGDFTGGKRFTAEEVFAQVGRPEDWSHREKTAAAERSENAARSVAEALFLCRRWESLIELDAE